MKFNKLFIFLLLMFGLVNVGYSITEDIGVTPTSTSSNLRTNAGMQIIISDQSIDVTTITRMSGSSYPQVKIGTTLNGDELGTYSYSGNVATIPSVTLSSGTTYYIQNYNPTNIGWRFDSCTTPVVNSYFNWSMYALNTGTGVDLCVEIQNIIFNLTPLPPSELTFTNITANNVTLINNTFYNDSITFETTVLNSSTNGNVNHSYSLNGAALVQYATNSLTGSTNLNLSEGFYNISFNAFNNETSVNSTNYSFIVDRTAPVIQKLQNISEDSFEVNFSTIFNVTDALSGLASCTINITELENVSNPDDMLINCTDTETFETAGLHNLFLTAVDNAGNVNTFTENFTINPKINIFFTESNGSTVFGYEAIIYHPDGRITFPIVGSEGQIELSPVNNGSLDLGNHTIQFSKLGFATENFTQILNETNAGINVTFNVTSSKIIVSIFDRVTGLTLTGLTTLTGVATVGFTANTTTGFVNISNINFISETYQIVADHENYTTESVFFNYDNQELLNIEIFLLPTNNSNFGTATVQVKSFPAELFISAARCDLLEWKPSLSAYESISQGITDVNGEYTFNIELNIKLYKALCTSEGNSQEQILGNGGIITNTGLTYPVLITTTSPTLETKLDDLLFSLINTTETNVSQRITFTWSETNGIVSQGCINVYQSSGFSKSLLNQTCASGSSGQIQIIENINNTYTLIVEAVVITSDSVSQALDSITFLGNESFESMISKYHLDLVIPIMFFFIGLGLGLTLEPQNIYISIITIFILEWVTFAMIPTTVSFTTVTFISVILGFMYWGVNK